MTLLVVSMVHLDHDNYDDAICLNQRLVNMVGCSMVQKLLAREKSKELTVALLIAKFLQRRQQKAAEKRNIVKFLLAREKAKESKLRKLRKLQAALGLKPKALSKARLTLPKKMPGPPKAKPKAKARLALVPKSRALIVKKSWIFQSHSSFCDSDE